MDYRPISALLIEEDPDDARLLELRLEQCAPPGARFKTRRAASLAEGLSTLDEADFDIVFLGLRLRRGLGALGRLRERPAPPPVVVYTGCEERDIGARALRRGAAAVLHRDLLDLSLFRRAVAMAFLRQLFQGPVRRGRRG